MSRKVTTISYYYCNKCEEDYIRSSLLYYKHLRFRDLEGIKFTAVEYND